MCAILVRLKGRPLSRPHSIIMNIIGGISVVWCCCHAWLLWCNYSPLCHCSHSPGACLTQQAHSVIMSLSSQPYVSLSCGVIGCTQPAHYVIIYTLLMYVSLSCGAMECSWPAHYVIMSLSSQPYVSLNCEAMGCTQPAHYVIIYTALMYVSLSCGATECSQPANYVIM